MHVCRICAHDLCPAACSSSPSSLTCRPGVARRGDLVFQDDKEDHADEDCDPRRGEKDNHYAAGLDEDDTTPSWRSGWPPPPARRPTRPSSR